MKRSELTQIVEEAYFEVLEEAVLATSTQQILGKFPTLNKTLVKLMTNEFGAFVSEILWVAPKPTTFKITLKNGQSFYLKWLGKSFQAQVGGKKYYLKSVDEYQQALDAIGEILKYSTPTPVGDEEEGGFGSPEGFGEEPAGGPELGGFGEEPGAEEPEAGEEEVEFT